MDSNMFLEDAEEIKKYLEGHGYTNVFISKILDVEVSTEIREKNYSIMLTIFIEKEDYKLNVSSCSGNNSVMQGFVTQLEQMNRQANHTIQKLKSIRDMRTLVKEEKVHGIAVYEKSSNKVVEFIECDVGRPALKVLSGIRINMSPDYKAEETSLEKSIVEGLKQ